jgi:Ca2+-binding RTX toxin-like protein
MSNGFSAWAHRAPLADRLDGDGTDLWATPTASGHGRAATWASGALARIAEHVGVAPLDFRADLGLIFDHAQFAKSLAYGFTAPTTAVTGDGAAPGAGAVAPLLITADAIPGDRTTTATLTVDGEHLFSTIDTLGDQDFYRVDLTAGQTYEFGVYMKLAGPSGVPLNDAYVEIYDADGNLLASADGGGPNTPEGLDALLSFTPETSGTFYVNARAFDQAPDNGTTGDSVGDYEVFARTAAADGYKPFYSPDSPLYSIDWGTQVDGSSRNPDGDQGPRDNGQPFTGTAWNPYGIEGKNVITYYLAKPGELYIDEDPTTPGTTETMVAKGWSQWEIDALKVAFAQYEKVADIVYVEVDNRAAADFTFVTYLGTPGPGVSLLGRMSPPDEENEGQAEFNAADERWTPEGLARGGFTFTTLIHEMGHGHGLAHPHDNGGHSGVMHGVTSDGPAFAYTNGDYDLNQGVYTMMSYEDGWEKSPYGQAETTDPYGWLGGLMAFDIAAIQDKYGVNEDTAKGDDVYTLKDVNAPGTFYESIWDAGGVDEIRYDGARDANIDLRAATLKYEYGGGGWVSYATGIYGGFTIANGVTIENATSGSGNDVLTGNDADNVLVSGGGDDTLTGGAGDDVLRGGTGDDGLDGGAGYDVADYSDAMGGVTVQLGVAGPQITGGGGTDTLTSIEGVVGSAYADTVYGGGENDRIAGGGGFDWLLGGDGNDVLDGGAGADHLVGGNGFDTASYRDAAAGVSITLQSGVHTGDAAGDVFSSIEAFELSAFADKFSGTGAADTVFGLAGDDVLWTGAGADQLWGGSGNDILSGGDGADVFGFEAGFGRDRINDFRDGLDKIRLLGIAGVDDFTDLKIGRDSAGNAVISFGDGSNSITLAGVASTKLDASDFLFA